MGNWNINIQGVGSHHNKRNANDANRMAAKFVQDLRDAGHTVQGHTFTHGGVSDIDGKAYLETLDETEKPEPPFDPHRASDPDTMVGCG